jgi:hypothetical protein
MADINFYAGEDFEIGHISGSGLGFYSNGFGYSVPVGSYQSRTFITNSTGASQGAEVDNNKYSNSTTVIVGQAGSGISLTSLPNYLSTLNIRFTNDSPVTVQNAEFCVYDGVNVNNNPSGLTFQACEIIHPSTVQGPTGSGLTTWTQVYGSGSKLSLSDSPGTSGLSPNGPSTNDARHDWFVALSCSPNSVGAKTFSGQVSLEFL